MMNNLIAVCLIFVLFVCIGVGFIADAQEEVKKQEVSYSDVIVHTPLRDEFKAQVWVVEGDSSNVYVVNDRVLVIDSVDGKVIYNTGFWNRVTIEPHPQKKKENLLVDD